MDLVLCGCCGVWDSGHVVEIRLPARLFVSMNSDRGTRRRQYKVEEEHAEMGASNELVRSAVVWKYRLRPVKSQPTPVVLSVQKVTCKPASTLPHRLVLIIILW